MDKVELRAYPKNPFKMIEPLYSSVFICVYLLFQHSKSHFSDRLLI